MEQRILFDTHRRCCSYCWMHESLALAYLIQMVHAEICKSYQILESEEVVFPYDQESFSIAKNQMTLLVFLYYCLACRSCPAHLNSIGKTTWAL